jgi:hypothetical protein
MKASLKKLVREQETAAAPEPPPEPLGRSYRIAATQSDTRQVSAHFSPEVAKTLKLIAVEQDKVCRRSWQRPSTCCSPATANQSGRKLSLDDGNAYGELLLDCRQQGRGVVVIPKLIDQYLWRLRPLWDSAGLNETTDGF